MGLLNDLHAHLPSVLRLGFGMRRWPVARDAERALVLYDFEACPFCRKAREALSHLGLDVDVRPVAKTSPRRAELRARGGRMRVPYLADPNTGREMYESEDIVRYLYATYGDGRVPWLLRLRWFGTGLSWLATAVRPTKGLVARGGGRSEDPPRVVELYAMESCPYSRKVREALSSLDLPYRLHNVPRGSPRRGALVTMGGRAMVPYLVDPNTGRALYESDDIVAYLEATYG